MGRKKSPPHPPTQNPDPRAECNLEMGVLLYMGLTLFGSFGEKAAEHGLTLLAPAFGTLVFPFFPVFYRKVKRIFLPALLALELVVWHNRASFQFLCYELRFQDGHQV
jgi:hypothetical protein